MEQDPGVGTRRWRLYVDIDGLHRKRAISSFEMEGRALRLSPPKHSIINLRGHHLAWLCGLPQRLSAI